jgi:hypothetical protein
MPEEELDELDEDEELLDDDDEELEDDELDELLELDEPTPEPVCPPHAAIARRPRSVPALAAAVMDDTVLGT